LILNLKADNLFFAILILWSIGLLKINVNYMKKLQNFFSKKRFFKRLFSFKHRQYLKKRWFLFFSLIFLSLLLSYLVISISRINSVRLEFLSLKNSFGRDRFCHEDCLLERRESIKKIVSAWQKDPDILKDWEKYWQESLDNNNYDLQIELLTIALAVYGAENPPDSLINFLLNKESDPISKANIINIFLSRMDDSDLAPYYFSILQSKDDDVLKSAVVKALSNISLKEGVLKAEDLEIIKRLLLDTSCPDLKLDLFFLLSDYKDFFPEEFKQTAIYIYDNTTDPIIKYLAADCLLSLNVNGYPLPSVLDEDWQKYFNL
jgi:hypothetical protein